MPKADEIQKVNSSQSIGASLIDLTEASRLLKVSIEKGQRAKKKKTKKKIKKVPKERDLNSNAIPEEQTDYETTYQIEGESQQ